MNTVAEKKPRLTTSAMIASIAAEGQRVKAAPFGKALVELAANRPEIVGVTADLAKYTDLHLFAQAYPDRFYQMGSVPGPKIGGCICRFIGVGFNASVRAFCGLAYRGSVVKLIAVFN